MIERRFIQCDVFSETPLMGNGLAVVVDGSGLDEQSMQNFAAWTNLSETAYLFPPTRSEADYKVRIFTPTRELDFAGHPTLGSCAAWLHAGGTPRNSHAVVQECNVGTIVIDTSGELPGFVAPKTTVTPMTHDIQALIIAALEIDASTLKTAVVLDNGSVWHLLELDTAANIMAVNAANVEGLRGLGIGLLAASVPHAHSQFDIRMLSESTSRYEDPITGSLNAAVGMWLSVEGRLLHPTIMAQGIKVGRIGRVHLVPSLAGSDKVLVAGRTHILIDGKVSL